LYQRPLLPDRLFISNYDHEAGTDCSSYDEVYQVLRTVRDPEEIQMHFSTILSGDSLMRSAIQRDTISREFPNALCFEMEAAGVMDTFPWLGYIAQFLHFVGICKSSL
jgi:nucleoside phosphorylase